VLPCQQHFINMYVSSNVTTFRISGHDGIYSAPQELTTEMSGEKYSTISVIILLIRYMSIRGEEVEFLT